MTVSSTTSSPLHRTQTGWRVATLLAFSLLLALIAGDASLLPQVSALALVGLTAWKWKPRRASSSWLIAALVVLGVSAAIARPLSWVGAAVFGAAAFVILLLAAHRIR